MVGLLADIEPEVMDEHIACTGFVPTVVSDGCRGGGKQGRYARRRYRATGSCCTTYRNICARSVCARRRIVQHPCTSLCAGALHTPDLYRKAMVNDPAAIQYFKPELLTREMCHEALYSSYDLRVLRYIPYKEIHEQLLERCEGYSRTKYFLDSMNPDYMTPKLAEMIFTKEPELFYNIPENSRIRSCAKRRYGTTEAISKMVPEALKHRSCAWKPYVAVRMP